MEEKLVTNWIILFQLMSPSLIKLSLWHYFLGHVMANFRCQIGWETSGELVKYSSQCVHESLCREDGCLNNDWGEKVPPWESHHKTQSLTFRCNNPKPTGEDRGAVTKSLWSILRFLFFIYLQKTSWFVYILCNDSYESKILILIAFLPSSTLLKVLYRLNLLHTQMN